MGVRIGLLILFALLGIGLAHAHDHWSNGDPVPDWVKSKCCHSNEAVNLTKQFGVTAKDVETRQEQVTRGGEHGQRAEIGVVTVYHVKGFRPDTYSPGVYPSVDGDVWAFSDIPDNPKKSLHFWCLFVPCAPKNDAAPSDFGGECS